MKSTQLFFISDNIYDIGNIEYIFPYMKRFLFCRLSGKKIKWEIRIYIKIYIYICGK